MSKPLVQIVEGEDPGLIDCVSYWQENFFTRVVPQVGDMIRTKKHYYKVLGRVLYTANIESPLKEDRGTETIFLLCHKIY